MDFRHPHFAEPAWLWLAVLAPVALALLQWHARRMRQKQMASFAATELWPDLLASHSRVRRLIKEGALLFCVALIGFAMARPQWGETTETSTAMGEDILFLLDCSRSMLASDVAPNRLTRSKFAILDFVQKHGRGRVGLVAFSGDAFLQCPLTFDFDAFQEAIQGVDDRTIPVPGTDIGRALDEGYKAIEKSARKKILILVTDGEDLENSGKAMAKSLGEKGVTIYTIGVGTSAGSPIQIINERGMQELLRDSDGNTVVSHLDAATLTTIAEATHGSYHPLGSLGDGISQVRYQVETSTMSSDYSKIRKLGVDRFYFFVAVVILLMVIESLLGTRRKPHPRY